jgi:hypothetical protein
VIDGFDMPVEVKIDGINHILYPSTMFKKMKIKNLFINIDKDYYVYNRDLKLVVNKD